MSRKFGDIINNLEKQIDNYIQHRADINSFGKVRVIGDGVARVFGLSDVQAGETSLLVNSGTINFQKYGYLFIKKIAP